MKLHLMLTMHCRCTGVIVTTILAFAITPRVEDFEGARSYARCMLNAMIVIFFRRLQSSGRKSYCQRHDITLCRLISDATAEFYASASNVITLASPVGSPTELIRSLRTREHLPIRYRRRRIFRNFSGFRHRAGLMPGSHRTADDYYSQHCSPSHYAAFSMDAADSQPRNNTYFFPAPFSSHSSGPICHDNTSLEARFTRA